jgi:cytochrome c-type biogenesis protein CcmH
MTARMMRAPLWLAIGLILWAAQFAAAVEPAEMLKDPALEARARAISREIRCLVCQNQAIDDSNADLAHDLRVIVRERLSAGDSDQQVKDYLTARYGDFVLLDPPLKGKTLILWIGPAAVLLLGIAIIGFALRHRRAAVPAPLNEEESRRLARLLDESR